MPVRGNAYLLVVLLAVAWAAGNCVYVYLIRGGAAAYRVESAVILLAAVLAPLAARPAALPAPEGLSRRATVMLLSAMAALWLGTFLPLLGFPFLSDDYVFLGLYRDLEDLNRTPQFFRPLFATVFWALAETSAPSPWLFHLAGFSLHLGSSWLVFRLALRLFADRGRAALCGTAFLLNPLQVEAVLWISGLQELLWTFFALAALAVHVGAPILSRARMTATLVLAALALLSKETALCLLLLLPAADRAFHGGRRGRWLPLAYGMLLGEVLVYLAVRARYAAIDESFLVAPSRYLAKQFVALPYRFFAQPWNAAAVDIPNAVQCVAAVAAIVLLAWAVAVRRDSRGLVAGAFVVLASTLPVYGYFFVRSDLQASRYLYFAAAGWGMILAGLAGAAVNGRRAWTPLVAGVGLAMAASLQLNLRPWRTAAEVVAVAAAAVRTNTPPDLAVQDWMQRTAAPLELRESVPVAYHGVPILANGYDEFIEHVRRGTD